MKRIREASREELGEVLPNGVAAELYSALRG